MTDTLSIIHEKYMNQYGNKQQNQWRYYKGDEAVIPIYRKKSVHILKEKSWNPIHSNFFKDIITFKRGYMGEKIDVKLDSPDDNQQSYFKNMLLTTEFKTDMSRLVEYASVEGIAHRLSYIEDGVLKTKNLHAWEVVYEYDHDIYNPDYAYYFYTITDIEGNKVKYCNLYDRTTVEYFVNKDGTYILDPTKERQAHGFNIVPITPYMNNPNIEGNCDQTTILMDAYDTLLTATATELNSMAMALLKIRGELYTGQYDDGTDIPLQKFIEETTTLIFGPGEDGRSSGDAEFVDRKIDDSAIEHLKETLREDIYALSGSVNLKELTSAERVYSIRAGMQRLETDAMTTENYFKLGILKDIKLWVFWMSQFERINLDILNFDIEFGRVYPQDEQAEVEKISKRADTLLKLSNVLDIEDALRLAGYEDYETIAERAKEKIDFMEPIIE